MPISRVAFTRSQPRRGGPGLSAAAGSNSRRSGTKPSDTSACRRGRQHRLEVAVNRARSTPLDHMSSESHVTSLGPKSSAAVPRAVWVGGGLLALVTAALAGALVMRSIESPPAPAAPTTVVGMTAPAVPSATAVATPSTPAPTGVATPAMPSTASAPPTKSAPTGQAKPSVRHVKPATSPETVVQTPWNPPGGTTSAALCTTCGVVESVNAVQQKGEATGLGAVAGGVLGGVAGHQVGGGHGKTAMTVLGAIGGGLAGNEVEKRVHSETVFDVRVRMEDGSTRVVRQSQSIAIGTRVVVDGTTLRAATNGDGADAPRTMRTSAPAGSST